MRTCTELCDLGQGLGLYPLNNIGIERVFPVIVQNPIVRSLTEREMLAVGSHQSTMRVFIKSSSRVIRAFSPPIGRRFLTPVIGRPRLCVNDTKCHSAGKNGHDFRRKSPA